MTSRVTNCSCYEIIGSETLTKLDQKECVELLLKKAEIAMAEWALYSKVHKQSQDILMFLQLLRHLQAY